MSKDIPQLWVNYFMIGEEGKLNSYLVYHAIKLKLLCNVAREFWGCLSASMETVNIQMRENTRE